MKHKRILSIVSLIIAGLLAGLVNLGPGASAAGERMYLSPASRSAAIGSRFTVAVRVNAGAGINAVQANLSYPADTLEYVSIAYGSAFTVQAESSAGGGSIHIGRGAFGTVTGDQLVATLTFKAKASSGSATVNFTGGSVLASDGAEVPSSKAGATITFTEAPKVEPTPTPTPPPPKDTAAPAITAIAVKDRTPTSFMVTWKTSEPSDSLVEYGLDTTYGLTATTPGAVTDHAVKVTSAFVLPLLTYHYRVRSADAAGNPALSSDQSADTPGVMVTVKVSDLAGRPVSGAEVKLAGKTDRTNAKGEAGVEAGLGQQTLLVSYRDRTVSQAVTIGRNELAKAPATYNVTLGPDSQVAGIQSATVPGLALAGLAGVMGAGYLARRRLLRWWQAVRPGSKTAGL